MIGAKTSEFDVCPAAAVLAPRVSPLKWSEVFPV
jgi:hypothetical protein